MNLPDPDHIERWLKLVKRWMPMIGSAFFILWIAFLVLLSLFQSPTHATQPPTPLHNTGGMETGCVVMSDGVRVCDETAAVQPLCAFAPSRLFEKMPKLSAPAESAQEAVKLISSVAGISPSFMVFAGDRVPGVAFAAIRNGQRVIVYDANKFRWEPGVIRWRNLSVTAHEIGHHLGGHTTLDQGSAHEQELEADRFSGYILSLLGSTLGQALSFTPEFPEDDSDTHPGREKRIAAITEGWEHGQKIKHERGGA
jgi:hypothetical protein